jgi:hypothetical protein
MRADEKAAMSAGNLDAKMAWCWAARTAVATDDLKVASRDGPLVDVKAVRKVAQKGKLTAEKWVWPAADLTAAWRVSQWAAKKAVSTAVAWVGWTAVARAAPKVVLMAVPSAECWVEVWAARWAELTVCSTAGNLAAPKDVMTAVWKAGLKVETKVAR